MEAFQSQRRDLVKRLYQAHSSFAATGISVVGMLALSTILHCYVEGPRSINIIATIAGILLLANGLFLLWGVGLSYKNFFESFNSANAAEAIAPSTDMRGCKRLGETCWYVAMIGMPFAISVLTAVFLLSTSTIERIVPDKKELISSERKSPKKEDMLPRLYDPSNSPKSPKSPKLPKSPPRPSSSHGPFGLSNGNGSGPGIPSAPKSGPGFSNGPGPRLDGLFGPASRPDSGPPGGPNGPPSGPPSRPSGIGGPPGGPNGPSSKPDMDFSSLFKQPGKSIFGSSEEKERDISNLDKALDVAANESGETPTD